MMKQYIQDSIQELNHVTWPTRKQAIRITIIVLVFMLASAIFLGIVDQIFAVAYKAYLSLKIN